MTSYIKKEELVQMMGPSKNKTLLEECFFTVLTAIIWVLLIFIIVGIITIPLLIVATPFILLEMGIRKIYDRR